MIIYFHTGLGKAASTFLQYAVFPKLHGIAGLTYIQRTQFPKAARQIAQSAPGRFLVSREFDQQLERECVRFRDALGADLAKAVRPIIVLRRQDAWFASQYRRHIKNGSPLLFNEFIDVVDDRGLWKCADGFFLPKLQFLESCFGTPPAVFFYEGLRRDPMRWLSEWFALLQAPVDPGQFRTDTVHASYSEHQLRVMRRVSRRLFPQPIAHGKTGWLQRRARLLACYAVLYSARLIPESRSVEPLIAPQDLESVRHFYADDWAACQNYAAETSVIT